MKGEDFFSILGGLVFIALFVMIFGYGLVGLAVGLTWPFWMFT